METKTTEGAHREQRQQQQQQSGRIAITYITLIYASLHACVCVCGGSATAAHVCDSHTRVHICVVSRFLV